MGWLRAGEALQILAVRPQTLYANVSRRRIRARPDPQDPRRSLYHEADVRRLAASRPGARRTERVAAAAIEWGDPILPSAISTVTQGRLWYRGRDAVGLAGSCSLEQVAALLWDAPGLDPGAFAAPPRPAPAARGGGRRAGAGTLLSRLFAAMATRAGGDPPSHARGLPVLRREAAGLVAWLACAIVGAERGGALHERLAAGWRCRRSAELVRRALVLLADHELNASTFAARVTVSTGASLASGMLAGLATLSGPLHGRASLGVVEMVRAGRRDGFEATVCERLRRGAALSGFGHPLYPDGDVRAQALLCAFEVPADFRALRTQVEALAGERPNIDFALAALTAAHRLPADAPLTLFALGRSVGWLAHALEQVATGHLIRPRARYVGPPPEAPVESREPPVLR